MNYRRSVKELFLNIFTSGPLMGVFLLGLNFSFTPRPFFNQALDQLWRIAPPGVWGVASMAIAVLGYSGLFLRKKRLWLLSHGFAVFLFLSIALLLVVELFVYKVAAPIGMSLCLALFANALVRFKDLYKEPFPRE